ncbi:MAG TPA: hypothetical protein ENN84_06405 [Candidatus Marinimicrobia bacterium]|nr:hypothetical protein [Candidatus Neomarinimicrobiota bacterium]
MKKNKLLLWIVLLSSAGFLQAAELDKKALLKSLVLPGWGELSIQENRGRWLMAADLTMLASIIGLQTYARDQNNEMRGYAALHANADAFSDENQYWIDLGSYLSWQIHREAMLENRAPEKVWEDAYAWEWSSVEHANQYRTMRRARDLARDRATLIVGAMVFNRIVSALDLVYLSNRDSHIALNYDAQRDMGQLSISFSLNTAK